MTTADEFLEEVMRRADPAGWRYQGGRLFPPPPRLLYIVLAVKAEAIILEEVGGLSQEHVVLHPSEEVAERFRAWLQTWEQARVESFQTQFLDQFKEKDQ